MQQQLGTHLCSENHILAVHFLSRAVSVIRMAFCQPSYAQDTRRKGWGVIALPKLAERLGVYLLNSNFLREAFYAVYFLQHVVPIFAGV
jgi:hypothetical protein